MTATRRRRFEQTTALSERLRRFADEARAEAQHTPEGQARKQLLQKIELTEKAMQLDGWLS